MGSESEAKQAATLPCHDYSPNIEPLIKYQLRRSRSAADSIPTLIANETEVPIAEWIDFTRIYPGLPELHSAIRRSKQLSVRFMSAGDIGRMVKRRMAAVGLPFQLSPHSFRVATITDLLEQGVPLEDVQNLAGHADPRTTRLYDRRNRRITRNIVERISI